MEPRRVVKGDREQIEKFVQYYRTHLPDISERPDIPVEKVQFWMMTDEHACRPRKKRKRFPRPHALLKGLKGKDANSSFDFSISCNKWFVTFCPTIQ